MKHRPLLLPPLLVLTVVPAVCISVSKSIFMALSGVTSDREADALNLWCLEEA